MIRQWFGYCSAASICIYRIIISQYWLVVTWVEKAKFQFSISFHVQKHSENCFQFCMYVESGGTDEIAQVHSLCNMSYSLAPIGNQKSLRQHVIEIWIWHTLPGSWDLNSWHWYWSSRQVTSLGFLLVFKSNMICIYLLAWEVYCPNNFTMLPVGSWQLFL